MYVGGLAPHVDEGMLRGLFAPYGELTSCNLIRDKVSVVDFGVVSCSNDAEKSVRPEENCNVSVRRFLCSHGSEKRVRPLES